MTLQRNYASTSPSFSFSLISSTPRVRAGGEASPSLVSYGTTASHIPRLRIPIDHYLLIGEVEHDVMSTELNLSDDVHTTGDEEPGH